MKTYRGTLVVFDVYGPCRDYDFATFTDPAKAIEFAQEWLADVFDNLDEGESCEIEMTQRAVTEVEHAELLAEESGK